MTTVCALAGGVGAAKMLRGVMRAVDPSDVTAIVNTGDDVVLHGLHVSPDLDTITYTLAEAINPETEIPLRNAHPSVHHQARRWRRNTAHRVES